MKIKKEHREIMRQGIESVIEKHPECLVELRGMGLSEAGVGYSLLRVATIGGVPGLAFICDVLGSYADDRHIETAVRHIMKEISGPILVSDRDINES